ncbi:MAG: glutamine--fructose-6-phosphate transaminase (isomerizing), partial [bacterium]
MCGIIGYTGGRQATPILIGGLRKLEYRGYDSAGVSVLDPSGTAGDGRARVVRCRGKLAALEERLIKEPAPGTVGIGHTRWATHGGVTESNAHPLTACNDRDLAIVLNGIVENFRELRDELTERGHALSSETDAEVVAHLLEEAYDGDLVAAVRAVYERLEGHFTFVVIHKDHPSHLVGVRNQTPMVVGIGKGEMFLASNLAAFLAETRQVQY